MSGMLAPNPIDRKGLVVTGVYLLGVGATQHIDHIGDAKPLLRAGNAREELLRVYRAVFQGASGRAALPIVVIVVIAIVCAQAWIADITRAARLVRIGLAEVGQQHAPTAVISLAILQYIAELAAGDGLFLWVGLLRDHILDFALVSIREEQHALRGLAIASGAPRFLIIAFERAGKIIVDDGAHVGFGDAHTKRDCRHQHWNIVADKAILVLGAIFRRHPRMVRQRVNAVAAEPFAEIVYALAALAIDD